MPLEGRDLTRLRDIGIYASGALDYLNQADGKSPETLIQDAILRCFDAIGETARAISPQVKAADVPAGASPRSRCCMILRPQGQDAPST